MSFSCFYLAKGSDSKYWKLWDRYVSETPESVMKEHNYRRPDHNSFFGLKFIVDDDADVFIIQAHPEDVSFDFETPMALVLFLRGIMILLNCGYGYYLSDYKKTSISEFDFVQFDLPVGCEMDEVKFFIESALDSLLGFYTDGVRSSTHEKIVKYNVEWVFKGYWN